MRRSLVASIWIGGVLLAAALYQAGPDGLLQAGLDLLLQARDGVLAALALAGGGVPGGGLDGFASGAFDALRAGAVAAYVVFLLLGLLGAARRVPARLLLALVSAPFLLLTLSGDGRSEPCWALALLLAVVGAVAMTRRLTHVPRSPAMRR